MRADPGKTRSPQAGARVRRFELGAACLAAALALSLSVGCLAQAGTAPAATAATANPAAIAFPAGYTRWTHIKSGLITSAHAAFPRFGGLHHVYANPAALQGLRGGAYPDGAVLVYDLFETRDNAGIVDQGPRRHIDVMVKDSARFQASGGWGYAEFAAGERSDRLKGAERDGCAACHATRRAHGDVFSEWGNAGEADASS
ncbi:cytochrome P460 family protein [Lysobacter enzymogenes]|uniref:cytochrome P460 family protein n=1 Tax=Lysobacter enzymogenes TaxID=69 RepID=UPI001A95AD53|nr:cytochrome P460 family protein [Lysobacter enzymogenes]QQP98298.1 cytochrome P460 family protein [Lysobacter enzymogenes]